MYAQLVAAAMREWSEDPTGGDLCKLARRCREELASPSTRHIQLGCDMLAAEVRYDAVLLRLCESLGIETSLRELSPSCAERHRLEHELAARGIWLNTEGRTNTPLSEQG